MTLRTYGSRSIYLQGRTSNRRAVLFSEKLPDNGHLLSNGVCADFSVILAQESHSVVRLCVLAVLCDKNLRTVCSGFAW